MHRFNWWVETENLSFWSVQEIGGNKQKWKEQ